MQLLVQFPRSFWQTTGAMAPFLLFGFFCTALSVLIVKPDFIERHLGESRKFSVLKAALFGVPLPLWLKNGSAVLLFLLIGFSRVKRFWK